MAKGKLLLMSILAAFIILQAYSVIYPLDIWWDSAVFLGMGKYIYSLGSSGFFEQSRPIIWPIILGALWKIGLNPIFFGTLIVIILSAGSIVLSYFIAENIFGLKTAIITAIFMAFSQTFFLFSHIMHTEIPSLFFLLLSIFLLITKRYNSSAFFLGIAVMTRFYCIFAAVPLLIYYAILRKYRPIFFFIIPIIPYLIFNQFMYGNMIYPFLLQVYMSLNTGWIFNQPIYFYFINIIKENFLVIFGLFGLFYVFKDKKNEKRLIAIIFLATFIPYLLISHKEMRLLITAFPFMYMLSAYGITKIFGKIKMYALALIIITVWLILAIPQLMHDNYDDGFDVFYNYTKNTNKEDVIWVSNPAFTAYSDNKVELIYYPLYNSEKIDELTSKLANAKHILINTCDILPCPPSDNTCDKKTDLLINMLKITHKTEYDVKKGDCEFLIFSLP